MREVLIIGCLLGALSAFPPALAQDRTLEQIDSERREAEARDLALREQRTNVEADVARLKSDMSQISREADTLERQAETLSERVEGLQSEASALDEQLARDQGRISQLVAALQRIEANPPPVIANTGESAIASARAAKLTSTLASRLKARSDQLAQDLVELESVKAQLAEERAALSLRLEGLSARRSELRTLSREKASRLSELNDAQAREARRIAKLAQEADTLRELLARVEQAAKAEPRIKPDRPTGPDTILPRIKPGIGGAPPRPLPEGLRFADARGQIGLPVRGRIVSRFGRNERGISVSASSGAQVVSPYGGRVEFAGPFKNYDRLVILNTGGGYFMVLTGLGETFVSSGETVTLGEPLGQMPRRSDPRLYIELRKDGRTIDPGPWMRAASG